jgi:two-component system chemotaxis sensor kinase CheA
MANEPEQLNIDPQLLQDFLLESREALENTGQLFVELEENPEDNNIINQIFRPVHSVKGNSSFFGLLNIKQFSHALENLLQNIRNNTIPVSGEIIDVLLKGNDTLLNMLERLEQGDYSIELHPEEQSLIDKVNSFQESKGKEHADILNAAINSIVKIKDTLPEEKFKDDILNLYALTDAMLGLISPNTAAIAGGSISYKMAGEDITKYISAITKYISEITENWKDKEKSEEFLASLKELSQKAHTLNQKNVVESINELESDFNAIYESGIGFDSLMAELIIEKQDALIGHMKKTTVAGADRPKPDDAATAQTPVSKEAQPQATEAEKASQPQPEQEEQKSEPSEEKKGKAPATKEASSPTKTIRVAEEKVDSFMSYVGELIITSEVFSYIQKKLSSIEAVRSVATELKQAVLSFNDLSTNLQKSLMEIRRVPLKNILGKLPRVVRDLSKDLNKDINLKIEGQMVQIDKSLLEGLESPITHMVRNCVDHAIEMPEDRVAAGKPAQGEVVISASCTEELFTLKIIDDGKGLDSEAILKKAVEKGQISADRAESMTEKEIYKLIFGAGISTAKKVTEVSGRGVGMDVVRSNIESMNGTIDIDSEKGKGTTFTITLPMTVTLLVIDGLLAQIGQGVYLIPVNNVTESLKPKKADITTVKGKGEVVNVRDTLYPLVKLHNVCGEKPIHEKPEDAVVVIAETDTSSCALMVDDLLGQQSVVLKELSSYFQNLKIIKGGAILGSGKVGLVLDVEYIVDSLSL